MGKRLLNPVAPPENYFLGKAYEWHARWSDQDHALPGPGTGAWAWQTYGLPPFSPIGAGIHALSHRARAFYERPSMAVAATIIVGIPRIAGQYAHQPLLNPYTPQSPSAIAP